jgi:hypothetical protein
MHYANAERCVWLESDYLLTCHHSGPGLQQIHTDEPVENISKCRAATVVEQTVTELDAAVSKGIQTVVNTRLVFNLMKQKSS